MIRFVHWVASTLLLLMIWSSSASAKMSQIQSFNFDFDDNLVVTGAEVITWDLMLQKDLGISTANWAILKSELAPQGLELHDDGLRFFGDTTELGENLFRDQVKKALKNPKWKGPSWNAFVRALSDPSTSAHTSLITARLHHPDSVYAGLQVLQETNGPNGRPLLTTLPKKENLYPVAWPGLPEQFKAPTPAESKAKVMTYLLDQVEAVPVPKDATWVEKREGDGKKAQLHLWGFSDDDYNNVFTAYQALSAQVKQGRWPHVKIVLFFTGLNNPVHPPAQTFVIRPDGTSRPALVAEEPRTGANR